jgi:uncharacterized protein with GYD domain
MPAYVTLFNFTEQGLKSIKGTVDRARAANEAAKGVGARFIGIWWLLGEYDGILIFEAPDEETATRQVIANGMLGNIRTKTMRAFSEEEMERIVGGLP